MIRTIKEVVTGSTQYDGAGVKLVRVISHPNVKSFDPFLMLDAFDSDNPQDYIKGFPWHPHRGIETITYLIEGEILHEDSIGNKGTINDGCCQWMTAGGGIMHQEMPQATNHILGVQLWLNLPAKDKMTKPKYHDIRADMITNIYIDNVIVRVLSGIFNGNSGAIVGDYVKANIFDIEMPPNSSIEFETNPKETLFVYIINGEGFFEKTDENLQRNKRALLFNNDGDKIFAKASSKGMRFLCISGMPLNEPVAWGGPIVMNTDEELEKAFMDLRNGDFVIQN